MKIILIRHGDAGAYTHPDSERNLSDTGKAQAAQTANWLETYTQNNDSPSLFISSPYNRAYQTCEIVRRNFGNVPLQIYEHITPSDDAENAIKGLDKMIDTAKTTNPDLDCVVIVFHMSIVAYMASILTGDRVEGFGLAEARVLETEVFAPTLATEVTRFVPN